MIDPLTQAVEEQKALIKGVRDYALAHYDRGWDIIVEAYTDVELMAEIGQVRTVDGAIRKLAPVVKLHKEKYDDVLGEVF